MGVGGDVDGGTCAERRVDDLRPGRRLRLRLTGVDLSCDASAIVEGCLFFL